MSGGAPLANKIYLTNRAHPHFDGTMNLFLVRNIALQVYKCLSTPREGAELHLQKQTPYFKTGI